MKMNQAEIIKRKIVKLTYAVGRGVDQFDGLYSNADGGSVELIVDVELANSITASDLDEFVLELSIFSLKLNCSGNNNARARLATLVSNNKMENSTHSLTNREDDVSQTQLPLASFGWSELANMRAASSSTLSCPSP